MKFLFFLLLIFTLRKSEYGNSSEIEDQLETQIDPREPRSFHRYYTTLLSVRLPGFSSVIRYLPDGRNESYGIGSWEIFAKRYWYEMRIENASCEQIPAGIAATCDWALLVPCLFGDVSRPPNTIFVQHYMLSHFVESTLKFMDSSYRFVLVSGGTDLTIPRSVDRRYHPLRGFSSSADGGDYFQTILNSPQIIHWFCENHDLSHPKISTLPTGMSIANPDDTSDFPDSSSIPSLLSRPLKVLVSDRVRSGTGTWALRGEVVEMCQNSSICFRPPNSDVSGGNGINRKDYLKILASLPFVACVRGGGLGKRYAL
jgi:hypothetical protein